MTDSSIANWVPAKGHTVGPPPEDAGPITLSARMLVSNTGRQVARLESEGGLAQTGHKERKRESNR